MNTLIRWIPAVALSAAVITGCGGDSGQENTPGTPPPAGGGTDRIEYNGPAAATDDISAFQVEVWDKLTIDDRCGGCHNEQPDGIEPRFMRRDNINLAYEAVLPLVDKSAPILSRLVERAAEGHGAWDPSAPVVIENLITRWATATGATQVEIVLTAPEERTVSETRRYPTDSDLYAGTIWPLVRDPNGANCMACHSEDSPDRQAPFFASSNVDNAAREARTLINLDPNNIGASRFIERMREDHNTWPDPTNALTPRAYSVQEMTRVVSDFVNAIEPINVPEEWLVSNAVGIAQDGVVASAGGRIESDVVALYQFREGSGSVAFDTSGVDPALNLQLTQGAEWVGSWGIRFEDRSKAFGDTTSSRKLYDLIRLTGEYSVEAWVVPGNVVDEERRIITYSGGNAERNFALMQTIYDYEFLARTENSDVNGMPLLNTPSDEEVLQATLQHVVATYDPLVGRRIYVNGEVRAEDPDATNAGNLADWDDGYVLTLGNEADNASPWAGTIRLLAIHNRVLEPDQVTANFDAGVGQKYFLLFGVSHLIDLPSAYIVFGVEVFDDYSYLFQAPFFTSLDPEATLTSDVRIAGMRIGINGEEPEVSQAFSNVDVTVRASEWTPGARIPLATNPGGTLVALNGGPENDLFFLTFEQIGSNTYARPRDPDGVAPPPLVAEPQPDIGLRIFDEIFHNMSAITTVPAARVEQFYNDEIRRSLPGAPAADGFLASHQSSITQLSLAYCTELINDNSLRSAFFSDYGSLSSQAERDALINPLLARMLIRDDGSFTRHPDAGDIRLRLDNDVPAPAEGATNVPPEDLPGLLQRMSGSANSKATAVCTSVLASAAMLMQ